MWHGKKNIYKMLNIIVIDAIHRVSMKCKCIAFKQIMISDYGFDTRRAMHLKRRDAASLRDYLECNCCTVVFLCFLLKHASNPLLRFRFNTFKGLKISAVGFLWFLGQLLEWYLNLILGLLLNVLFAMKGDSKTVGFVSGTLKYFESF